MLPYRIITPVQTEPVTLAEAKAHLNQLSETFADDMQTLQSIPPGSHAVAPNYSLTGATAQVGGYECAVNLSAGTCGSGGSIAAKLQDSDDLEVWEDVPDGAFAVVTEESDNAVQEIAYTGGKEYVRVAATVAGAACDFSADVMIRSGDATDDELIASLITAAREYCEDYTSRALATQTLEAYADAFPCKDRFELPMPPLQSVESVKYKNSAGTETTLTEGTDYLVDDESAVAQIVLPYGKSWPSFTPWPVNPVKVRFTAGYADGNPAPKTIKQAMLMLIGHWYVNREAVLTGTVSKEIEFAVKALLSMKKTRWF